ncbi:MAG: hypothetical protein JNM25_07390 [Planctomycetes bacterium]|nr:hypothetical protein [Planctomycetota bacterium]
MKGRLAALTLAVLTSAGIRAQECPPVPLYQVFGPWPPGYPDTSNTFWLPGPSVPGNCPNEPCRFYAWIHVEIYTPSPTGPDVTVQVCQRTNTSFACGPFPIPHDASLPAWTQMAEGDLKWEIACGEFLQQELQMDTPIGFLTFIQVSLTCRTCI